MSNTNGQSTVDQALSALCGPAEVTRTFEAASGSAEDNRFYDDSDRRFFPSFFDSLDEKTLLPWDEIDTVFGTHKYRAIEFATEKILNNEEIINITGHSNAEIKQQYSSKWPCTKAPEVAYFLANNPRTPGNILDVIAKIAILADDQKLLQYVTNHPNLLTSTLDELYNRISRE